MNEYVKLGIACGAGIVVGAIGAKVLYFDRELKALSGLLDECEKNLDESENQFIKAMDHIDKMEEELSNMNLSSMSKSEVEDRVMTVEKEDIIDEEPYPILEEDFGEDGYLQVTCNYYKETDDLVDEESKTEYDKEEVLGKLCTEMLRTSYSDSLFVRNPVKRIDFDIAIIREEDYPLEE